MATLLALKAFDTFLPLVKISISDLQFVPKNS